MNPQITTTNANRYNTEESIVSSRPHATEIRIINSLSQFDRFLIKAIKTNVQIIYTCLLSIFSPKWFAVSFSAACKEQLQNKVALSSLLLRAEPSAALFTRTKRKKTPVNRAEGGSVSGIVPPTQRIWFTKPSWNPGLVFRCRGSMGAGLA